MSDKPQYDPIPVTGTIIKYAPGEWKLILNTEAYALHDYDLNVHGGVDITLSGYRDLYQMKYEEWRMNGTAALIDVEVKSPVEDDATDE